MVNVNKIASVHRAAGAVLTIVLLALAADGRSLQQAGSQEVNLIATVVGSSVSFSGDDYGNQFVSIQGVQPVVSYSTTSGGTHGGAWQMTSFVATTVEGVWIGSPDAALYGYNNEGEQVVMLLGAISNPQFNAGAGTLGFNAQLLSAADELARVNGVTNYVQEGKGGKLLTDPPVGPLNNVAIMMDLTIAPQPASAAPSANYQVQELAAIRRAPTGRRGPFGRG